MPGGTKGKRGPRTDNRKFLDALLWMARSSGRWRDLPERLKDWSRRALKPIRIRNSKDLNYRIEQDHRRIKHRMRSMLGFKSFSSAAVTLAGIEMVHMM